MGVSNLELLLIWIAFGVVCAIIASSRGRSSGGWFVLGAIAGVFALIVLLALPSQSLAGASQEAIGNSAQKKCPRCAELVKAEALVCRFCGYEFQGNGSMRMEPRGNGMRAER